MKFSLLTPCGTTPATTQLARTSSLRSLETETTDARLRQLRTLQIILQDSSRAFGASEADILCSNQLSTLDILQEALNASVDLQALP